jgi:hypothetical protein
MKLVFVLTLSLLSSAAMAFSEIRCDGLGIDLDLDLWGSNGSSARASLVLNQNGTTRADSFTMWARNFGNQFNVNFSGAGYYLTINTWPDVGMRPLRSYRSTFRAQGTGIYNLNCTYWN